MQADGVELADAGGLGVRDQREGRRARRRPMTYIGPEDCVERIEWNLASGDGELVVAAAVGIQPACFLG